MTADTRIPPLRRPGAQGRSRTRRPGLTSVSAAVEAALLNQPMASMALSTATVAAAPSTAVEVPPAAVAVEPEAPPKPVTAAVAAAAELKALGTECFFLMTGRDNTLWIALQEAGIRQILARTEAGAVYMADGYARVTGRPTFVYGAYGPGPSGPRAPSSRWHRRCVGPSVTGWSTRSWISRRCSSRSPSGPSRRPMPSSCLA